jgi:hypothetical protein
LGNMRMRLGVWIGICLSICLSISLSLYIYICKNIQIWVNCWTLEQQLGALLNKC